MSHSILLEVTYYITIHGVVFLSYSVINATAYPNGNSICVECVFSSASSAKSCYVSVIGV